MDSNRVNRALAVALICACLGAGTHSAFQSYVHSQENAATRSAGAALVQAMVECPTESCRKSLHTTLLKNQEDIRIAWIEEGSPDPFGISRGDTVRSDTHGESGRTPEPELAEAANAALERGGVLTLRLSSTRFRSLHPRRVKGEPATVALVELTPPSFVKPAGNTWAFGLLGSLFGLFVLGTGKKRIAEAIPLFSGVLAAIATAWMSTEIDFRIAGYFQVMGGAVESAGSAWTLLWPSQNSLPFEPILWAIALGSLLGAAFVPQISKLIGDLRTQPSVYAYVTPALLSTLILVFVPFVAGIGLAFFHAGPGDPSNYAFAGFDNFTELLQWDAMAGGANVFQFASEGHVYFEMPKFYFTLIVTILWTILNVFLHLLIGLGLALLLNRPDLRFRKLYRVLLIIPWAVPSYITALTWKMMFHTQYGSVNHVLQTLGLNPVDWLGNGDSFSHFASNFTANLVTNTWLGFPFMMVVSLGALQSIPTELYEAASIDGATRSQRFKWITLPLLKPALLPAVLLGSIWTFNMFNVVYLVSGGAPFGKSNILITEAFRYFNADKNYGMAAAYSVVIFLILLGYASVTNRVTKATEGALK